jgi:hypothetical protein
MYRHVRKLVSSREPFFSLAKVSFLSLFLFLLLLFSLGQQKGKGKKKRGKDGGWRGKKEKSINPKKIL